MKAEEKRNKQNRGGLMVRRDVKRSDERGVASYLMTTSPASIKRIIYIRLCLCSTIGSTSVCLFFFSSRRRHTRFKCDWSSDVFFFFSSRRRHTRFKCDWSSDVCSSDLWLQRDVRRRVRRAREGGRSRIRAVHVGGDRTRGGRPADVHAADDGRPRRERDRKSVV